MNYKINIVGALLPFRYYHLFELDFKTRLHFLMIDIFHSDEKKKGLVYFKKVPAFIILTLMLGLLYHRFLNNLN